MHRTCNGTAAIGQKPVWPIGWDNHIAPACQGRAPTLLVGTCHRQQPHNQDGQEEARC